MEIIQNDYSRQVNILNPEEFKLPIHIIGAGATGSWVAFSLAKMGLNNITVYDFDEIGMHNLPNQMFNLVQIGKNKANAIRTNIKSYTGINIKARNTKVEGNIPLQGIVFLLTDTMKSRKDIYYKSIKNNPMVDLLIETRMDLRGGRIYAINPKDRLQTKIYEETLYDDSEAEISACGVSQTVLPSALAITSHAIWKLLNFINNEPIQNEIIMDFSNEILMTQIWSEESKVKHYPIKNKVIHCKTEEQAKILLDECDKQEMLWISGEKITDKTHWNMYTTNTCYHIEDKRIAYADLDYFYEQDMKVYSFNDVFK